MGSFDCRDRPVPVVEPGEMTPAATVRRPEPLDRTLWESPCDLTLDVRSRRADDIPEGGGGVAEQVVDMPVARLALAGSQFTVALDPREAAASERASGVRVPARRQPVGAERADLYGRGVTEFHQQRVRPAVSIVPGHNPCLVPQVVQPFRS